METEYGEPGRPQRCRALAAGSSDGPKTASVFSVSLVRRASLSTPFTEAPGTKGMPVAFMRAVGGIEAKTVELVEEAP